MAQKTRTAKTKTEKSRTQEVSLLRIIDGDTVEIQEKRGFFRGSPKERVRLWGIDAPESDQTGGKDSTKYLVRIVGGRRKIWLTSMGRDQYGRIIGIIHPDRRTLRNSYNYEMVKGGHAHCYMLAGKDQARYRQAETEAQTQRRGLWKKKDVEIPRQFRVRAEGREKKQGKIKWVLIAAAAVTLVVLALKYLDSTPF